MWKLGGTEEGAEVKTGCCEEEGPEVGVVRNGEGPLGEGREVDNQGGGRALSGGG